MLNEEINRIKSLFGDDRLYGNLVETCDNEDEAAKLIKDNPSSKYSVIVKNQTNKGCGASGTSIDKIAKLLKDKGQHFEMDKQKGYCYIEWEHRNWSGARERFIFYERDKIFKRAVESTDYNKKIRSGYKQIYGLTGDEDLNRIYAIGTYDINTPGIGLSFKVKSKRDITGKTIPILQASGMKKGTLESQF